MSNSEAESFKYDFEIVPDFFINYQHVANQCPRQHMTTQPSFGLIYPLKSKKEGKPGAGTDASPGKTAPSWQAFMQHVELANDGLEQAEELRQIWEEAVTKNEVPLPGAFYTSPLRRCLETTKIVFSQLRKMPDEPFRPVVKELLRESLCNYTCDRRSSHSWIASHYPDYAIEPGFTEKDELWSADYTESLEEHAARKNKVLSEIFATDANLVISLTVHSDANSAILKALHFDDFKVREGSADAVLVKATKAN